MLAERLEAIGNIAALMGVLVVIVMMINQVNGRIDQVKGLGL